MRYCFVVWRFYKCLGKAGRLMGSECGVRRKGKLIFCGMIIVHSMAGLSAEGLNNLHPNLSRSQT